MELMKALAIGLHEDELYNGVWPEPATEVTQYSTYTVEFDEEIPYINYRNELCTTSELELDNLPFMEDYESGDTITKEEYNQFLADNPDWYTKMIAARPQAIEQIAELNRTIGQLINAATILADDAGVELTINLGQYGTLDPNSDWDSSRC